MNKRYSKSALVILGLVMLCLSVASGLLAYNLFIKIDNYFKYVALALLGLICVFTFVYGLIMLIVSAGMNDGFKTIRDTNPVIDNVNVPLCHSCGKRVDKKADFCDNCGAKIYDEDSIKICPQCKAKNKFTANFCEKCGENFTNEKE